jgi:hypothetical protein
VYAARATTRILAAFERFIPPDRLYDRDLHAAVIQGA